METFCSYVLLSKKSKHPLNTTRANDSVIPGKDQGPYLNNSTNACDKSKTHPTGIIIRFLVQAKNDNLATCAIP